MMTALLCEYRALNAIGRYLPISQRDLEAAIEAGYFEPEVQECFDRLYAEGADSGTVMCIPTHNYQVSCPHRMRAFEEALEYITGHAEVWVTTGREIARHFIDNSFEQSVADIAARGN